MVGPVPGGGWRGEVAFDVATCAVHVAVVDLDAGAYARDVRLARVWNGAAWGWADDWTVRDGVVERPGRTAMPVGELPEVLEVDAQGRVVARTLDGQRTVIFRGDDGSFRGMGRGALSVLLTDEGGVATGDRTVTYQRTGTRIDAAEGPSGRVSYGYDGPALRTVLWSDSAALRIESDGTSGFGGRWRCGVAGDTTRVDLSGEQRWTISRESSALTVEDPTGARMQTRWLGGRLLGWTDADNVRVDLARSEGGRITAVKLGGESVATLLWGRLGLAEVRDVNGGSWRVTRETGGVEARSEPDGRTLHREVVEGRVRVVHAGAETTAVSWDAAGRPSSIQVGGQGALRFERDAAGALLRVQDGAGGAWMIERDGNSRPTALTDPAGARWELRVDRSGRLDALTGPEGLRRTLVRSQGRISQYVVGSTRWSWLRDARGLLAGVRDPEGRLTGLARDQAGQLVSMRFPDGTSLALGRDELGRLRSVGPWRISRDNQGRALEVRSPEGAIGGWSRDRAGRVSGFGMGGVTFELTRDAAGRIQSVRAGEFGEERWRLDRDSAGRVSAVTTTDGRQTTLLRDSAGRVTRLADELGTTTLSRDLRGKITRVSAGHLWSVSRDVVGRLVRVEVGDLGTVGADYERGGGLKLVRLADGALVRRNASEDAGEYLAFDRNGRPIGSAAWSLDGSGRLVGLDAGGPVSFERDPGGGLLESLGPTGQWTAELGLIRGPDATEVRLDPLGRPVSVQLSTPGVWGLAAGLSTYRWDGGGSLTGVDGSGGGSVLVHDALGRLAAVTLGERVVPLIRDGFGRLRKVGDDVLVGWDALLEIGGAPRAPISADVVARAGGAVFADPRGYPLFVPWTGGLRPWPTGWNPGVDAAEFGPGGRFVLPGGIPVDLLRAVDPLSATATTPDRWPWTPLSPELRAGASPFRAPDATTEAWWDAAPFDVRRGWAHPLQALCELGVLPGGSPEPGESPGLPWLPASFARQVPPPLAGLGGALLEEDTLGRLVMAAALEAEPIDTSGLLRAFLAEELASDVVDVPGLDLPGPSFLYDGLADSPFGH